MTNWRTRPIEARWGCHGLHSETECIQLRNLKLDSSTSLLELVPNLQVNGVVGEATPIFALRGISMLDFSFNQSSPVATYVDEVYKGNFAIQGVELYDLERVEILRGPQGTLYGQSTTGGAINFISRRPTYSNEGYVEIGVGNYNRRSMNGALQASIAPERLAARVAFTGVKADGWFKTRLPGEPDLNGKIIGPPGRASFLTQAMLWKYCCVTRMANKVPTTTVCMRGLANSALASASITSIAPRRGFTVSICSTDFSK
jgi:hypothetical protein